MTHAFFLTIGQTKFIDVNTKMINKLIRIRLSDYDIKVIGNEMKNDDFSKLNELILFIGETILKANLIKAEGFDAFLFAKGKFEKSLEGFVDFKRNKYSVIAYAAQLLQYYTMLCNEEFEPQGNYKEFNEFLIANIEKIGNTEKNVFIVEYKLIKIYNEISTLTDDGFSKISPAELEKKVLFLKDHLSKIQSVVDDFLLNAPDNVFSYYLDFVINYTYAKELELQYHRTEHSSIIDKLRLSDCQEIYLKKAKTSLADIEKLYDHAKNPDAAYPYPKGVEYCFGQDILTKLPIVDLNEVKTHLSSLLK